MGQLYKHQILRNNQNIITHDVHYKESVDQDQNKCYNKIVKDEFFTSSLDNPIREINYQTDSINGNVTRKTLSSLNVNYEDIKYQYDKFGQLISEENITDNVKTIYSYDKNGNINSKNEYVLSTNELKNSTNYLYNLNNANKLEKFIKNDVNLLINYDDNMTSMPVSFVEEETGETKCALEWDFRNLTKVSLGSNYIINYDYDARGFKTVYLNL